MENEFQEVLKKAIGHAMGTRDWLNYLTTTDYMQDTAVKVAVEIRRDMAKRLVTMLEDLRTQFPKLGND